MISQDFSLSYSFF